MVVRTSAALMRGGSTGPLVWAPLKVPAAELRLEQSLANGQCFGWRRRADSDVWVGVLGSRLVELRETESDTQFRCIGRAAAHAADEGALVRAELRYYFQLDVPLAPLYRQWQRSDERMGAVARALPGVRILRQEPAECLFSFICSSNNNIGRIGGMLAALRRAYGRRVHVDADVGSSTGGAPAADVAEGTADGYYTFPTIEALAAAPEEELRALGFGYRAPFVVQTAQALLERGGRSWLTSLRTSTSLDHVRTELCTLRGVGPKVADCVALFSLDQTGAIPVDVHVWQIACRDFDPTLREHASLTPKVYAMVGDLFRRRYGEHAGWAHSLLFAAELPAFRGRLPAALQEQMAAARDEERESKQRNAERRREATAAKKAAKAAEPKVDEVKATLKTQASKKTRKRGRE